MNPNKAVQDAIDHALDAEAVKRFAAEHKEIESELRAECMERAREGVLSVFRVLLSLTSRERDVVLQRAVGTTWQRIGDSMGGKTRQAAEKIYGQIMARHPDVAAFFNNKHGSEHE